LRVTKVDLLFIHVPLFMVPLLSVLSAPIAAFVVLKFGQAFVPVRNFTKVWVIVTYILLVVQAIGVSVMFSRLLPGV